MYVIKMKKNLKYNVIEDYIYQTIEGLMEVRIQNVIFSKILKDDTILIHHARIITYVDIKKYKLVSLLTNDMELDPNEIIEIYRRRWEIELLFKQIKQNFPLKYFYGESANAIKIQIWVTLIANPSCYGNEKETDSFLELFQPCNHDENYTYILCGFLQSFQPSGKGLGNSFGRESERR